MTLINIYRVCRTCVTDVEYNVFQKTSKKTLRCSISINLKSIAGKAQEPCKTNGRKGKPQILVTKQGKRQTAGE